MRNADLTGPAGQAWRLDLPSLMKKYNLSPDSCALVGAWVVNQPSSHPLWPWYRMVLIHLRELKEKPSDLGAPIIYLENATHEFIIEAIHPDDYPLDVDDWPKRVLAPANFGAQVAWGTDEEAETRFEQEVIKPVIHGFFNADTDGISLWISGFGDNMVKRD